MLTYNQPQEKKNHLWINKVNLFDKLSSSEPELYIIRSLFNFWSSDSDIIQKSESDNMQNIKTASFVVQPQIILIAVFRKIIN